MASSSNKREHHEKHFRGTWAHAALHEAVESGRLPALAAWLAMVIDAHARNGDGCYASNRYLGMKIHKQPRQIQRLLEQLEQCGFLISKWKNDHRYLKINWEGKANSKRVTNHEDYVIHRYNNHGKAAHSIQNNSHVKSDVPPTSDLTYPHVKSDVHRMNKDKIRKNEHCRSAARSARNRDRIHNSPHSSGNHNNASNNGNNGFAIEEKKPALPSFANKLALLLHESLANKNAILRKPSIANWSRWMQKLIDDLVVRDHISKKHAFRYIKDIITWHVDHLRDDYEPQAFSADSFYNKFDRIESAERRNRQAETKARELPDNW